MYKYLTDKLLMVRPVQFKFNNETAVNNYYQHSDDEKLEVVQQRALAEFDNFVKILQDKGIEVKVITDSLEPSTPDSIFPNNWFSTDNEGRMILYPMYAKNRRMEVDKFKQQVLDYVSPKEIIDYTFEAQKDRFLEGTGSIVLDRKNKKAYCSISPRSDKELFLKFCEDTEYKPVIFTSYQDGAEIYHTNVMMSIGENKAIICLDSISDKVEKENVIKELKDNNKEIIEISLEQVKKFLGNVLEVKNNSGERFLVMSKTAYTSLNLDQKEKIEKDTQIIYVDVSTIEYYGGGSARCMLAEIYSD